MSDTFLLQMVLRLFEYVLRTLAFCELVVAMGMPEWRPAVVCGICWCVADWVSDGRTNLEIADAEKSRR